MDFFPRPNKKLITIKEAFKRCTLSCNDINCIVLTNPTMRGFPKKTLNNPSFTICKTKSDLKLGMGVIIYGKPEKYKLKGYMRFPTLNEIKCLSSFPLTFKLNEVLKTTSHALIGNSVPPKFMNAIAKTIRDEILN